MISGWTGFSRTTTALLSPALRWDGESTAKPNRPTWQQRKTRAAASFGLGTRSLRFGYTRARRPKPRAIAGISRAVPGCGREVSATADWVAERAVDREPVSLPKSLIYRENTGNSPETGFRGEARFSSPSPFRGPTWLVSLNSETGKSLPTNREFRDANSECCS